MLYHKKHSSTVFIDAENNIFSSKADITVKNGNYGIVNNIYDARLLINNNITVTLKGSGEYAVGINAAKSVSQIVSSDIKKTTKVSFESDSANNVSAYGWRNSTRSWNIGGSELLHNFNISCKGATASAYGIYSRGISSSAVFKSNFTVSAHGSQNAYAYALYITLSAVDLHTLAGKFTITANSTADGEACGIFSTRDVSVDNITGSWNITGKDAANAWGIQAAGKTVIGNLAANIRVSGLESRVFHIEEIPEEDAGRSFEANSIAGKITAAAIYSAYGISSWGSVSIGDMSKMNMKITGKKGNAYGFYIFDEVKGHSDPENLIIAEGGLDVGKISVTAAETACGIYVYDAIAASEKIKINHITGSITAKGRNAYGIEANSFTETIKSVDYNTICSASISATGSDFACGIQFNEGDLTLDGSKITAKTTELALEEAAKQLGAPSVEALEYEIVEKEKKGFLGLGSTPAVVHVSYRQGGVEIAREFIERLLADMKIEATLTLVDVENADKQINIDGKDVGALIGHHGETLDSLQYLVNLAANQKTEGEKREFVKITIDIEGYRAKREEALRSLARRMADRVIKYKKSVMLEPMNPYERRIIHSEVQNIKGVSTNSIGSENNRKVVIYLEDKE